MNLKEKIGAYVEQSRPMLDPENEMALKNLLTMMESSPKLQDAQKFTT